MARDIIPKSPFPAVPFADGVPVIDRLAGAVTDPLLGITTAASVASLAFPAIGNAVGTAVLAVTAISNIAGFLFGQDAPQWGIFDANGNEVLIADSVLSVEYRNASLVSDYHQEKGAFASYNKVGTPYSARIIISSGGDYLARIQFLNTLESLTKSLDLYNIITPEITYTNANVEAFDYRRTSETGAGMIIAELFIREIRQASSIAYSPKSDSAQSKASSGSAETQTPTPSVAGASIH